MDKIENVMQRWNALKPLSERDRELLSRRFTIDFNYNSNHIEGNTLTYGQTEILLLFGKIVGEAEAKDVHEMTASNVGLKMMTEEAHHKTDLTVGATPSLGAHASKRDIQQFLTYFTNLFVEEVNYNISFLSERGENVWWFDGERIKFRTNTTSKILNLIYVSPDITIQSLSEQIGVSMTAINKQVKQLTDKGYIQRSQTGEWRLIITPSI
jgi:Fic family protein